MTTSAGRFPGLVLQRLLALGRRVTSGGAFIPEIDGLRFIAIAWVLLFHITGEYGKMRGAGFPPGQAQDTPFLAWIVTLNYGVQLFFVISGFILGLPFIRHYYTAAPAPDLRQYYLRRLSRIEPPLIINLTICLVLLLLIKGMALRDTLPHFLASVVYCHYFIYQEMSTINFVTWSLEIEAQFYLLAPALITIVALPARWREWALVAAIAASAAGASAAGAAHPFVAMTLLGQLPYFLAGFLLAVWHCRRDQAAPRTFAWDAVALLAWAALTALLQVNAVWSAVLWPFATIAAYMGMFRGRCCNRVIVFAPLTMIGGMCYTIYLYHPFLKSGLKHLTFNLRVGDTFWVNALVQVVVLGGLIAAISWFIFLACEKPFMRRDWPARLRARLSGGGATRGPDPRDVTPGPGPGPR